MKRQHHIIALCVMLVLMAAPVWAADSGPAVKEGVPVSGIMLTPENIQGTLGPSCHIAGTCGELSYIDCDSAQDGPSYYVRGKTLSIVMKCGGICNSLPDKLKVGDLFAECPPKEWTCNGQ